MGIQNYKVKVGSFGRYPAGCVIPSYVAEAAAGGSDPARRAAAVREMVARDILEPTAEPVNITLAPPKPTPGATSTAPTAEVIEELNELRTERDASRADRDAWKGRCEAAETDRDLLKAEIANYVIENNHLRAACEEHQASEAAAQVRQGELEAQIAGLKSELELERATKPTA